MGLAVVWSVFSGTCVQVAGLAPACSLECIKHKHVLQHVSHAVLFSRRIRLAMGSVSVCARLPSRNSREPADVLCKLCAGGEQPASLHYLVAIFGRHREHRKGDKFLYLFAHTNASRQDGMRTHGHRRESGGINSDNLVSALTGVDIAVSVARSQHPHSIVEFSASTSAVVCRLRRGDLPMRAVGILQGRAANRGCSICRTRACSVHQGPEGDSCSA